MTTKLKRSSSDGRLSEPKEAERALRRKAPDQPLHAMADSPFSSASGFTNFRGLLNLGVILLVVSNFRVALENLLSHGVLARPLLFIEFFANCPQQWPCIALLLLCNAFAATALLLELLAERRHLSGGGLRALQVGNMLLVLAVPSGVILQLHPNPLYSTPTLGVCCVLFLKLWSYHDVNRWCRSELRQRKNLSGSRNQSVASALADLGGRGRQQRQRLWLRYPENVTLQNLYHFLLAPTLCYELNFPTMLCVRRKFLVKRCLELLFLPQVAAALVQQWIVPLLHSSMDPLEHSEWPQLLERLLRLAVPNHLIWLIFFYAFFHTALNAIGELLLFGDRNFYSDWWNSESVSDFWKRWNVPVHRFAKRHIFLPLVKRWRLSSLAASVVVFCISAFFHELLVSVPLRMFRLWAFSGMMLQLPLAALLRRAGCDGQLGNVAVWLSLILGQPLAMLMYYHDYYVAGLSA